MVQPVVYDPEQSQGDEHYASAANVPPRRQYPPEFVDAAVKQPEPQY